METKRKDNLFAIVLELIIKLVELGILIPISNLKSHAPKSKDDNMAVNGYFRISSIPNLVWLHVEHGYGIFINEYIVTRQGERINLVEELSKYYWYIDNSNNSVRCNGLSNRAIWRCIGSLILYGDIKKKMPSWLEVHHKWWRWCNTQNTISFVCMRRHKHFHDYINSRKSHREGVVLTSGSLMGWINIITKEDIKWSKIPM